MRIGLAGLGVMGYRIGANLAKAVFVLVIKLNIFKHY